MKAKRKQVDGEIMVIKLFAGNYARDQICAYTLYCNFK